MKKNKILKGACVLLITVVMIISSTVAIADPVKNPVTLKSLESKENKMNSNSEITNRGDLLWDNGMTNDPDGAWSNFDAQYGGANRSLMDDVVIPPGEEWKINELQFYSVWYGEEPGHGTDFVLNFWSDNSSGPGPGTPLETVETISYGEEKTGGVMFGRNTSLHTYQFKSVVLTEGTYWIEGRTVGMDNNFWFVNNETNITGSECWLNWEYDAYFGNGTNHIGYPADLIFALYYNETLEPPEFEINITGFIGVKATITIKATITNIGDADANNVSVTISLDGGLILLGKEKTTPINSIAANGGTGVAKLMSIGFGSATINVTVTCDEGVIAEKSATGFVLLFLVLGVA